MNLKVANLIAVQFGIFIGVMSWLVYSHLPSSESRSAAEMKDRAVASFAPVAPIVGPRNQRPGTGAYRADRERAQPVEEIPAPTAEQYYQEIVAQPYGNSARDNGSIAGDSPAYANVDQEPAVIASDYLAAPQTIIYAQPIVVFSNPRRFANRCRSTHPLNCAPPPITHQCPDRRNPHLSDTRVVSGPNISAPPCPPTQGLRPRENVRQTGVIGSQQKRVAGPGPGGATRRSLAVP